MGFNYNIFEDTFVSFLQPIQPEQKYTFSITKEST